MSSAKQELKQVDQDVDAFFASLPPAAGPVGKGKKGRKHRSGPKKVDLSINSLLDILSVLLVFLMKQYSVATVQVKPSKDLQVPFSHNHQQVEESTAITLTRNNIMVDDVPVLALEGGKVTEADLAHQGMLIQPLLDRLQDEVQHQQKIARTNKAAEFKGIASFIVDRHVPFPLLTQALYTAGQAEYSHFRFVLIKIERN